MMTDVASSATLSQKPARSETVPSELNAPQTTATAAAQVVRDLNLSKAAEDALRDRPKEDDVQKAIDQLNQSVRSVRRDIFFTKDKDTGVDVIKVIDQKTHEVIRQIPPEEVVNLARKMDEVRGMLFAKKA